MARKSTRPNPKRAAAESPPAKVPAPRAAAKPAAKKKPAPAPAAKAGPIALRSAGKRPAPASKNSDALYIYIERDQLHIATEKPKATAHVLSAATFDEAKEKAVDYLIELIDALERRLWGIKQASDLAGMTSRDQ